MTLCEALYETFGICWTHSSVKLDINLKHLFTEKKEMQII